MGDTAIGTVVTRNGRRPAGLDVAPDAEMLRQVVITMLPDLDTKADDWRLAVMAEGGPVQFHAWIERDDPDQSWFPEDAAPSHTLGSLASADDVIVVGAYDALAPLHRPAATFSSEGPTRDGRQKPDLIAPGVGILAARSTGGAARRQPGRMPGLAAGIVGSGTSQAAPHVAGAVALLFAAAGKRAMELRGTDLRDLLRDTARRDGLTPGRPGWDPHSGCGRLAVQAALMTLSERLGSMNGTPAATKAEAVTEEVAAGVLDGVPVGPPIDAPAPRKSGAPGGAVSGPEPGQA
ncbi:S8 family serine peptidase [Siccirubricoccus deserti]